MRYLLIDRIHLLETNKQIVAYKNVALSEDFFADHFIGHPVVPGALMIESVAQAATALLEVSNNFTKKALLVIVEQAKFRAIVQPGSQLVISVRVLSIDNDSAQLEGLIHVNEKLVMEARVVFALRDVNEFYPPKVRPVVENLYETWLDGATIKRSEEEKNQEKNR